MISIYYIVLTACTLLFAAYCTVFLIGLFRFREERGTSSARPAVSVVVPARNEEAHIGRCLEGLLTQDYDGPFEVIAVSDRSSDRTDAMIQRLMARDPRLRYIRIDTFHPDIAPKKWAITSAIREASGEIMLATDADCTHPVSWIREMVSHFTADVGMVAGYCEFERKANMHPLWFGLQSIDLLAMLACAMGSIRMGWTLASTGSNQAYRKEAFFNAGGFGRTKHLISGDDDLLMQNLSIRTEWRTVFSTSRKTAVLTDPMENFSRFYQQRKRWGAKYYYHRPSYLIFLTLLYGYDLLLLFSIPFLFFVPGIRYGFLASIAVKWLIEFLIVLRGSTIFKRLDLLAYFPLWAVLHIPYIVVFGPISMLGKVAWKGQPAAIRGKFLKEVGTKG